MARARRGVRERERERERARDRSDGEAKSAKRELITKCVGGYGFR